MNAYEQLANFFPWWSVYPFALALGVALGWTVYTIWQAGIRKKAELDAADLISEAREQAELRLLDEKEKLAELEDMLWTPVEKDFHKAEERIEDLEAQAQEKKQKLDNKYSVERQRALEGEKEIVKHEERLRQQEQKLEQSRGRYNDLNQKYVDLLCERLQTNRGNVIADIEKQLIEDSNRRALQRSESIVEEAKEHSEYKAKQILDRVYSRFARPYSSERGIASVYFENPGQREILGDSNSEAVKAIQELTGCDIMINNEMELIGVAGFDPVRRELTRRLLERILKERKPVSAEFVKRTGENIKRELLATIKRDGDLLAKELRQDGLHPEIRQMMGALRYRYSFTQNQYFHCGEVGWLCGLLAFELGGVDTKKARRSGMLHDLGKSMDHEMDGGHAVIGANFIATRGEAADVIHAVKAHHFDEQPATDMAYLVIAADAISGARPGARRSTMESYTQKVTELETIARSFDGVTDCYILSGGRECRVLVNGKKIDDWAALNLSRQIAQKIETECNYPGQIKVVVVRETLVVESTRPAHTHQQMNS